MFEQIAATVEAGGASALSFTALGTLILGYLANRWFHTAHVAVKIFIFLIIFLGVAGVYYTQLVDKKDVAIVLQQKKEEQTKAEEAAAAEDDGNGTSDEPSVDGSAAKPATAARAAPIQPPPPPMPLDELAALSDKYYDQGEFARAFDLNIEGCSRGSAISCRWNGYLLESGKGFAIDLAKAKTWYQKGCSLGDGVSCERKTALQSQ